MATTYYVSASEGNNNNPGNQPNKPLRTIQAAINKLQAGDTIDVRAGTYIERLHIQKPGTIDAPILITAHEGEQAIIDGANLTIPAEAGLVAIQQSQYVTLNGLTVRNAGGRGLVIDRFSHISVRGCTIESCLAGGIQATQGESLLIEKCVIHDCARRFLAYGPGRLNVALLVKQVNGAAIRENQVYENSDHGIFVGVGCRKVEVQNNTCYDNRNSQIHIQSAVDVAVDSNLCYHTGNEKFMGLDGRRSPGITKSDLRRYESRGIWHSCDIRISNNIVVGCGTGFLAARHGSRLHKFTLTHNTIVNSTEQAIKISESAPSTLSFIENNLIATSNGGDMAQVHHNEGIVWRYNLWSAYPGQNIYNPSSDVVDADVGLVNINAPVGAGALTADPFKLTGSSMAINRGVPGGSDLAADFWGAPRDGLPDIGASEYPNGAGDQPEEGPTLPAEGTRVTTGLVALYDFKQGQGREVRDVSGIGNALHLRITNEASVAWTPDGLQINAPTLITSERPATKIIRACRQSNEITVEAWIKPDNVTQDGPARIVGISNSKTQRNFTLGQGLHGNQPSDLFMARLRTTRTSTNGLPAVVTPPGTATVSLTHVAYTLTSDHQATLYVNGQDRGVLALDGDLSSWDERMPLLLADELSEDRSWLGLFHLVAVYSRALAPAEVLHNYEAGLVPDPPVVAEFMVLPGDEYGVAPHVVEFDSADSTAIAGITSHFWEFGDGQTSNRANPVYTYTTPGVYTVSLTVTDSNGLTDKIIKENLITVVSTPVTPLPPEYARFILLDVTTSRVMAFGIQYPDLRCSLMWNEDPFHMLVFDAIDHIRTGYAQENTVEIIWVDELEEV